MSRARQTSIRLTNDELNRYRREVEDAADLAHDYFDFAIAAFEEENPNASVAEERRFVIDLVRTALPNFTDIGATISCDFFDELREACEWPEDVAAQMYDMTDYDVVDDKIRYFAKHLNAGNQKAFREDVTDVTRYMVKRAAFENMRKNCEGQEIKYARVPSGFETCGFCFMLASRGFVYANEKAAGEGNPYHKNCDCIIVPGFQGEGGDPLVAIDGYDPKVMYENWVKCAKAVGVDPLDASEIKRRTVMAEAEIRDRHWLYTGELPKHDYSWVSRDSFGRLKNEPDWKAKPNPADYDPSNFKTKNSNGDWKDLFAHDVLRWNGFGIIARTKHFPGADGKDQQNASSPDLAFQRDIWGRGYLWEVKSPMPSDVKPKPGNELNYIENAFRDAYERNFRDPYDSLTNRQVADWDGQCRVVLNLRYRPSPETEEKTLARIRSEMDYWHIAEVFYIDENGKLLHIK